MRHGWAGRWAAGACRGAGVCPRRCSICAAGRDSAGMPDTCRTGVCAAALAAGWYKPGCGGAGDGNSILVDAEGVPAGELWRYPGAAVVSQPEIAGEICSVPSFSGAVCMDRGDADAATLSSGFGGDRNVYRSGHLSGGVGDGWADWGGANLPAVLAGAGTAVGGAWNVTLAEAFLRR